MRREVSAARDLGRFPPEGIATRSHQRRRNGNGVVDIRAAGEGTPDVGLALLSEILDGEGMKPRLRNALALASDSVIDATSLVALKAGARAVVAYRITMGSDAAPTEVFAKHFSSAAQAQRVHEIMAALWRQSQSEEARFGAPRPLAHAEDMDTIFYLPANGAPLDDALWSSRSSLSMKMTAEALVSLHSSPVALDRSFDVVKEVRLAFEWARLVAAVRPKLGSTALAMATRLGRCAPTIALQQDVPIHKDLHYKHVIVGDRCAFVDLDEMRFGDPSFDLAHFCAYLNLLGIRKKARSWETKLLEWLFLDTYGRASGWRLDERFGFFSTYTYLKIAKQLCMEEGVRPRPNGKDRIRQLRAVLSLGLTAARSLPPHEGGSTN